LAERRLVLAMIFCERNVGHFFGGEKCSDFNAYFKPGTSCTMYMLVIVHKRRYFMQVDRNNPPMKIK
jgi:hypothetical protein